MKEIIKKYKWPILLMGFILLNIGSMIYQNKTSQEKIYLSESIKEVKNQKDDILNIEGQETLVEESQPIMVSVEKSLEEESIQEIPIYICGEVNKPGVYYVSEDAIVNDLITISGGFTAEADQLAVNLASPIQSNEKIIIPKQGEEIDKLTDSYDNRERIQVSPSTKVATSEQGDMIHLNTASKEELMTLSGIGEVKAVAIIAYRQENGGFNSIEEIKNISGIGEKTFEKIKPFITT